MSSSSPNSILAIPWGVGHGNDTVAYGRPQKPRCEPIWAIGVRGAFGIGVTHSRIGLRPLAGHAPIDAADFGT